MAENPRKLLYLSLTDRLAGLKDNKTVKHIGRWNNQITNDSREGASITPSILISIKNKIKGTTGSSYELQKGIVVVTCHIGINVVKIDVGTKDWDIMQAIYEKLQGECAIFGDGFTFTALDRKDEIEDDNYDAYYHGKVVFETYLSDQTKTTALEGRTETITIIDETVDGTKTGV
jgi:hypothetical protein